MKITLPSRRSCSSRLADRNYARSVAALVLSASSTAGKIKLSSDWLSVLLSVMEDAGNSVRCNTSLLKAARVTKPSKSASTIHANVSVVKHLPGCLNSFNRVNPSAVEWAKRRSALLVTDINATTRESIRFVISSALHSGIPPREAARLIKSVVGLDARSADAAVRLHARLKAARPGALFKMYTEGGKVRTIRIPRKGLSADRLNKEVTKYVNRLHSRRALLIARTETLAAANAGQRELWLQARQEGLLGKKQKRTWIATLDDRVRDSHLVLDGATTSLDEPFRKADGTPIEPGSEPRCRCAQGLVA